LIDFHHPLLLHVLLLLLFHHDPLYNWKYGFYLYNLYH
jgi:hypothetical protein